MSGAGGVPDDDGGDPYTLPATAAELRERRLAYLAKTLPQVVSVSFPSSEQGKVVDPVAAEATREVVSISSTSSHSSSDDDAPLIKTRDNDADIFEVTKPPKRGRGAGPVCPPTPFPPPFAAEYSSVDAVKQALKEKNAACIPRLRSTSGKYIRFSCKHDKCFLNISGCRDGSVIRLTASTYVPGDCDNRADRLMTSVDVWRSSAVEWKVMQGEVAAQSSVPIAAKLLEVKCSSISTWTLALGIRGLVTFSLEMITKQLFGIFADTGCGTTLCAI